MKMVGPFAATTLLDTATAPSAPEAQTGTVNTSTVSAWHALERLTGLNALLYVLPSGANLPDLPSSDVLLPYTVTGQEDELSYAACDLPPHAQHPTDLLEAAQAGLRALMTLHEAGLVHGAVGPQQLWLIDGSVKLAGAGLPWPGRLAPYAAPEGVNGTPEADLYALGVTLLHLGPLPEGLKELLSEYPARRPSARDALARLNAGPRLSEKLPLIVDAPRPKLPAEVLSTAEPLPLVADPDARLPDIGLEDTVLIPDAASRAAQAQQLREVQAAQVTAPPQARPPQPDPTPITAPAPAPTSSGPRVVRIQVPPEPQETAAPIVQQAAEPALDLNLDGRQAETLPPTPTLAEASAKAPDIAAQPLAVQVPTSLEVPTSPQSDIESLLGQFDLFDAGEADAGEAGAAKPEPKQEPKEDDKALAAQALAPEVADLTLTTPIALEETTPGLYPAVPHPEGETIHIPPLEDEATVLPEESQAPSTQPHSTQSHEALRLAEDALLPEAEPLEANKAPANMVMPAPSSAPSAPTPPATKRQFKPVKMKWDTGDGSWHVKHDDEAAASSAPQAPNTKQAQTAQVEPSQAQGLLTSQPVTPTQRQTQRTRPQPAPAAPKSNGPKAPALSLKSVPRWFWVAILAALLMVGLLWGLGKILSANREVGGTVTPPTGAAAGTTQSTPTTTTTSGACCSVAVQVFSAQNERLNVPVQFKVVSKPAASHLEVGQQVGVTPAPLALDAPGHYTLSVQAPSYHSGQLALDVPLSGPLKVILK